MERLRFKQHYNPGEIILKEEEIAACVAALGSKIAEDYKGKDLLIVPVFLGAKVVAEDLEDAIKRSGHTSFDSSPMRISSYDGPNSQGKIEVLYEPKVSPKGRNVLLVDDIIDKGYSLNFLDRTMREKGAASVKSFALLSKPAARKVNFKPDYVGFDKIPKEIWVEGYGMDSFGWGRENPNIVAGPTFNKDGTRSV